MINTEINKVIGAPIGVGNHPFGIAITPDGRYAYVADNGPSGVGGPEGVSVIDTQTNQVIGPVIAAGSGPDAIAITPDGKRVYVVDGSSSKVTTIDPLTNQVVGAALEVGEGAEGIAITPDGKRAYVTGYLPDNVSVIDTSLSSVIATVPVGTSPTGVAVVPDQPPKASFTVPLARPGVPVPLNASASSDTDGSIAQYAWSFGDGQAATSTGPQLSHAYERPGAYKVTLTLTDDEGCSTAFLFTGQTAFCDGSLSAAQTQAVQVAYPGIRVHCPGDAGRRGCRFSLEAVAKPHGKVESAVTAVKLRSAGSRIVSLKPKQAFAAGFVLGHRVIVRERVEIADRGAPATRS